MQKPMRISNSVLSKALRSYPEFYILASSLKYSSVFVACLQQFAHLTGMKLEVIPCLGHILVESFRTKPCLCSSESVLDLCSIDAKFLCYQISLNRNVQYTQGKMFNKKSANDFTITPTLKRLSLILTCSSSPYKVSSMRNSENIQCKLVNSNKRR